MKRDRTVIYKDFYTNKFSAVKAVIVVYLDAAFEDFFTQYSFNSKNFKDYDHIISPLFPKSRPRNAFPGAAFLSMANSTNRRSKIY